MAETQPQLKRHFIFAKTAKAETYSPNSGGRPSSLVPRQNRGVHGEKLLRQIEYLKPAIQTGVNHAHPLLKPAIAPTDMHSIEPGWGTDDQEGHGTEMAGLVLLGDLTPVLQSSAAMNVDHRLESVKLLARNHTNPGNSQHHGYLTLQAVSRPEIPESVFNSGARSGCGTLHRHRNSSEGHSGNIIHS